MFRDLNRNVCGEDKIKCSDSRFEAEDDKGRRPGLIYYQWLQAALFPLLHYSVLWSLSDSRYLSPRNTMCKSGKQQKHREIFVRNIGRCLTLYYHVVECASYTDEFRHQIPSKEPSKQ